MMGLTIPGIHGSDTAVFASEAISRSCEASPWRSRSFACARPFQAAAMMYVCVARGDAPRACQCPLCILQSEQKDTMEKLRY